MKDFEIHQLYKEKYPDGYLDHYFAMYSLHQDGFTNENFENQNSMYISIEGKEEFQSLRNEVLNARQNDDLDFFLKMAIYHDINEINLNHLDKLLKSIESHKF